MPISTGTFPDTDFARSHEDQAQSPTQTMTDSSGPWVITRQHGKEPVISFGITRGHRTVPMPQESGSTTRRRQGPLTEPRNSKISVIANSGGFSQREREMSSSIAAREMAFDSSGVGSAPTIFAVPCQRFNPNALTRMLVAFVRTSYTDSARGSFRDSNPTPFPSVSRCIGSGVTTGSAESCTVRFPSGLFLSSSYPLATTRRTSTDRPTGREMAMQRTRSPEVQGRLGLLGTLAQGLQALLHGATPPVAPMAVRR